MSNKFRPYLDLEVVQSLRQLYPKFPKSQDDAAFLNWYLICQLTGGLETVKENPVEEPDVEELYPKQREKKKLAQFKLDLADEETD